MGRALKTEAIVLRKLRYGEADSIVQLYTREFGRVGAIAKGVRRANSRFGGRLEPFFRLETMLHEGRSELLTITSVQTLEAHSALRTRAASLQAASRIGDFVLRLLDEREQNLSAYNLLANSLALLDADKTAATAETALSFRAKLLGVTGFAPELAHCVHCGAEEGLTAFSPSAGGVVCRDCREADDFDFGQAGHSFYAQSLASPLAETPAAEQEALRQVDRAIIETLAHHAHVRVRTAL
jgi:DNA repair protein RecO (recombination protein O)